MGKNLSIKMLGNFTISLNGLELTESKLKMKQLANLLAFMIYNREKHLSLDNLYNILWPNENSDNPAHALRNLVYRIRVLLKDTLDADMSYILTLESNSYRWNSDIKIDYDVDKFEEYIKTASAPDSDKEEQIKNYLKAAALYEDDFLISYSIQDWVVPIATYYRHMYSKAVKKLTELLLSEYRFDEALDVCLKATKIDQFDESLHRYIIDIYGRFNQTNLAIKHYTYIKGLFDKELGVKLSKETVLLYRQIAEIKSITETDVQQIKKSLLDDEILDIPLFCDYETLKCLYSLQIRNQSRKDESQFLLLVTLCSKTGKTPPKAILDIEMAKLTEVMKSCLRKNDVVANYSKSQFLLMLNSLSYENTEMVKSRIDSEYSKKGLAKILYSIVAVNR